MFQRVLIFIQGADCFTGDQDTGQKQLNDYNGPDFIRQVIEKEIYKEPNKYYMQYYNLYAFQPFLYKFKHLDLSKISKSGLPRRSHPAQTDKGTKSFIIPSCSAS